MHLNVLTGLTMSGIVDQCLASICVSPGLIACGDENWLIVLMIGREGKKTKEERERVCVGLGPLRSET